MKNVIIKRATGNYQYNLIKIVETTNFNLVIYKNPEPIFGGLYATSLLTKHNTEILTKNGLCLDAAIEVLNETLSKIIKIK